MATLVFTAVGTLVGGPLGGAIGSLIGNRIDSAVFGAPAREGPRLKELAVTTSSYGTAVPRIHGTMRVAGTMIWATDLVERREESGGGKGTPSTTSYAYSGNFAVALASNPIAGIGRIWADGNLLRGAAGDLKTGGILRTYLGHGDQLPDPLIASDQGAACPAFRGLAYCVFEALDLADFGNRIPALTFEVIGASGETSLVNLLGEDGPAVSAETATLPGLAGFAHDGGSLAAVLDTIATLYPLACDAGGDALTIEPADAALSAPIVIGEATMTGDDADSFAPLSGTLARQQAAERAIPQAVRYYDIARDYQVGVQRAEGRARGGHAVTLDFPGAMQAATARSLTSDAAERAGWARDLVSWRTGELSPDVRPGAVVRLPDRPGLWRVREWEWRETGVELALQRVARSTGPILTADAGAASAQPDLQVPPTILDAFELPFDGTGDAHVRSAYAAVGAATPGWRGAMLYLSTDAGLEPIQPAGRDRAAIGTLATALPADEGLVFQPEAMVDVELAADDLSLPARVDDATDNSPYLARVGGEVIGFAGASRIGGARWRITGLQRARGGTEASAKDGHAPGTAFVLLGQALTRLDPAKLGQRDERVIAAMGVADEIAIAAPLKNEGISLRPLSPVHPRMDRREDGSMELLWVRRARGAFGWLDGVDVPLVEEREAYRIGLGPADAPHAVWETKGPTILLDTAQVAQLRAQYAGAHFWVSQIGRAQPSLPTRIATLD